MGLFVCLFVCFFLTLTEVKTTGFLLRASINVMIVKLFTVAAFTEPHSFTKQLILKLYFSISSYPIKFMFCMIVKIHRLHYAYNAIFMLADNQGDIAARSLT